MKGWSSTVGNSVFRGHLFRANLLWGTMKWTSTLTYLSFFHSTYSSLKTMWRCSSSANIWLWSSKTPLKQSRVIIILNKKSGSRIWYSLYKGWESVSSLHYDMRFTAVKEREQSDKWSSTITTLKTASIFHSYALYSELHPLILLHPWSQKGLAGHCWGLSSEMCHKTDYRLKLCFKQKTV